MHTLVRDAALTFALLSAALVAWSIHDASGDRSVTSTVLFSFLLQQVVVFAVCTVYAAFHRYHADRQVFQMARERRFHPVVWYLMLVSTASTSIVVDFTDKQSVSLVGLCLAVLAVDHSLSDTFSLAATLQWNGKVSVVTMAIKAVSFVLALFTAETTKVVDLPDWYELVWVMCLLWIKSFSAVQFRTSPPLMPHGADVSTPSSLQQHDAKSRLSGGVTRKTSAVSFSDPATDPVDDLHDIGENTGRERVSPNPLQGTFPHTTTPTQSTSGGSMSHSAQGVPTSNSSSPAFRSHHPIQADMHFESPVSSNHPSFDHAPPPLIMDVASSTAGEDLDLAFSTTTPRHLTASPHSSSMTIPRNSSGLADSLTGLPGNNRKLSSRVLPRSPIDVPMARMKKTVNWKKGRVLGSGASGKVSMGINLDTGEMMAVKTIEFNENDPTLQDKLNSLQSEIGILKDLFHDRVVKYYFSERIGASMNIFMEFVPGGSIHHVLETIKSPLSEIVVVQYTYQLLEALQYLHERKIIHGDIKGANVLITTAGTIKLADFGTAAIQMSSFADRSTNSAVSPMSPMSPSVALAGTPVWMAPEVIRQEENRDVSVDIWSLGCTVMEMLTGKPPWSHLGLSAMRVLRTVASGQIDSLDLPPNISERAAAFIQACLQSNAQDRPTASQLMDHPFFSADHLSECEVNSNGNSRSAVVPEIAVHNTSEEMVTDCVSSHGSDKEANSPTLPSPPSGRSPNRRATFGPMRSPDRSASDLFNAASITRASIQQLAAANETQATQEVNSITSNPIVSVIE